MSQAVNDAAVAQIAQKKKKPTLYSAVRVGMAAVGVSNATIGVGSTNAKKTIVARLAVRNEAHVTVSQRRPRALRFSAGTACDTYLSEALYVSG
ncbi:MAG: hypothetical protein RL469_860 [Pseudomonadota bacterium]